MEYETKSMLKIVLGVIFILAGMWLLFSGYFFSEFGLLTFRYWQSLKVLLKGGIPLLLAVIGFLLVWVEYDELKQSRKVNAAK